MDDIIKEILEKEGSCSEKVKQVQLECRRAIEKLKRDSEAEKTRMRAEIIQQNRKRLESSIDDAGRKREEELSRIKTAKEGLMQDRELCGSIKERILFIILES